jgi:uncharacterized membrane protein YdbT with pleckstrin-like domain
MNYTLRPAWRSQWGLILVAAILFVLAFFPIWGSLQSTNGTNGISNPILSVLVVPLIVVCLILLYRHFASAYTIEDGTIESRRGIIARKVNSIRVVDVRNINVKQSILDRILGIGDIEFSSAAGAEAEVIFNDIGSPMRVKEKIQSMMQ